MSASLQSYAIRGPDGVIRRIVRVALADADLQCVDGETMALAVPADYAALTVQRTAHKRASPKDAAVLAVQRFLDTTARNQGYDSIYTACTYADEPAVPKFQAEGRALRAWRSQVWAACHAVQAEVLAGQRPLPTAEQLIALLPAFVPPS